MAEVAIFIGVVPKRDVYPALLTQVNGKASSELEFICGHESDLLGNICRSCRDFIYHHCSVFEFKKYGVFF